MPSVVRGAANVVGKAVDGTLAAAAAAWPRSVAKREVERLVNDGWEAGAICDFEFVLSFAPSEARAVVSALRASGFSLADRSRIDQGFLTARSTLPLRALELTWKLARLNRVARHHGGFAEMVGPVPVPGSVKVGRLRDSAVGRELLTDP